jgi:D-glycero-alpha-D-manno-heptose-7-phosphate kinase
MARIVTATAPTRVDFAGGTLDIYPLYLFLDGGITLNGAIDLNAEVTLRERADGRYVIRSIDTGAALEADSLDDLPTDGPLALITRCLRHFRPATGLDVETTLAPPHGSGLGASSALFIALAHALEAYGDRPRDPDRLIRLCNHLEAQLMGMPAGTQDYYPPSYGGILAMHYAPLDDMRVERMDANSALLDVLQAHLVVSYTNQTHHSGTTNWGMMRNFLDGVPRTVEGLHRIKRTADALHAAFRAVEMPRIAALLDEEWRNRRGLADDVTNPAIDAMMAAARDAGAWASKICGAGGGGCMISLAPPEARAAVIDALEGAGATYMDAHLVRDGVRVAVREAEAAGIG